MDIQKIRADFPMLHTTINGKPLVYLDNSATTHKPQQVIDSIIEFYTKMNSNIHRGVHYLGQQASTLYESARETVKDFLHASTEKEIVFTSGTTESINLIAHSFGNTFIGEGDDIIISEMEHHANIVPWQALCKKVRANLKVIPFDDNGVLSIDSLNSLITKKTKLISLTYVSNTIGTINPVKQIIHLAHDHNIPVLIDGAQAVQHMPINVSELDCDFFVFSGHKIFSETGVGVLYAKKKWLETIPPYHYGGGMISTVSFEKTNYADIPFKFEAGTRNISAVISLGTALKYVKNIGFKRIKSHEQNLLFYTMKRLQELDKLIIYGHAPHRCGIISMNLDNIHHYDAAMILDHLGIVIRSGKHCAEPVMDHYGITGTIRASIGLYNSKEDINRFIGGLQKVQELHKST
jgi:cysteine desulfurase/selenocysteine lyase